MGESRGLRTYTQAWTVERDLTCGGARLASDPTTNPIHYSGAVNAPTVAGLDHGGDLMAKAVNRSAGSGRFVSRAAAARWPGKTTTERVGGGTGNSTTVTRSASTGRFVTAATGRSNPGGTISQRI